MVIKKGWGKRKIEVGVLMLGGIPSVEVVKDITKEESKKSHLYYLFPSKGCVDNALSITEEEDMDNVG